MDRALIKEWVEALRSGQYSQIQNCLRNKNGYCCLGVLGDLFVKKNEARWNQDKLFFGKYDWLTKLPSYILDSHQQTVLAKMNDRGNDFQTIANYIEKNYLNENNNNSEPIQPAAT